jgi:hypothetical protein
MPDLFAGDVLIESRPLRDQYAGREEALDKVKILMTLPGTFIATTEMVATYYEVPIETIKTLATVNAEELESNGRHVYRGSGLQDFVRPYGGLTNLGLSPKIRELAIYSKRAVLNVAMLLRDSLVAQQVRSALLDATDAPPVIEDPLEEWERENDRARRAIEMAKELRVELARARTEAQQQREVAQREREIAEREARINKSLQKLSMMLAV